MTAPASGAIDRLIDLARWAPSGDNTQPWRFERQGVDRLLIHGFDTRDHCVYDLDGHASQMSLGALIETLHIAATEQQLTLTVRRRLGLPDSRPTFEVTARPSPGLAPDPLLPMIPRRSVCRRPLRTRALRQQEMQTLHAALPRGYSLQWHSGWAERWQMAKLMFSNAKLRLTMHEAYLVHHSVIDWGQRFSSDRVPDQALGVDGFTLKLMHWAMADWQRVSFMNRWLGGTIAPRLQMDLLPALLCAAHVAIIADTEPADMDDYVNGGRAVQRLWLTATALGLQHQPELTPLIFSRYVRQRLVFSESATCVAMAKNLATSSEQLFGPALPRIVWLGRLGEGANPSARSLRLQATGLLTPNELHE